MGESDHVILEFNITQTQATEHNDTRVLDFKRADFNKLRENLEKIPWLKILKGKTTQESWETLKSMIIEAQTSTIPLRKKNKKSKKKPAWLHKDLWQIERKKGQVQKMERRTYN
uniref:Reverse transcriptase domain-containing protein n=1 Tax=Micrurus corallinus TaxID=54390 RepID=A0A2D4ES36_MICCO